jgi:hypothetical protein
LPRIAFADESGTDDRSTCYAIGVFGAPVADLAALEQRIVSMKAAHGVVGEAKWTRVRNSHGAINFVLGALDLVLNTPGVTFDVIVVNKKLFHNWRGKARQRENAFYQTYTYLLRHIARRSEDTAEVLIDDRSDTYARQHEAMQTIGNRMLAQLADRGSLGTVRRVKSHLQPGVQLADVLTGAINTGHLLRLQPTILLHPGKRLAVRQLHRQLGWSHLAYDTRPHPHFNIWHFPEEYRGPTRQPTVGLRVPYVTAADLAAATSSKE